jgi:selenocysteine lyase/cysteine desulfurase
LANIEHRVLALTQHAVREGQGRGLKVVGPASGDGLTGIVSFESERHDLREAQSRLMRAGINTSLRRQRVGPVCLRLSPHFYNHEREILAALAGI